MLVLARKVNQRIVIGDNIVIEVLHKKGELVKLGIQAPVTVPVYRQEIYEQIKKQGGVRRNKKPPEASAVEPAIAEAIASAKPA